MTRRFPTLNFAFLEGGVGWACGLYSDLIGHWKKRNLAALEDLNPANIDRELLTRLFREYGGPDVTDKIEHLTKPREKPVASHRRSGSGARRFRGLRDRASGGYPRSLRPTLLLRLRVRRPDQRMGIQRKGNPFSARLGAVFGSDIGHFDVQDMTEVLHEAYELVEHGLIDETDFRDFVFTNPVKLWAANNPNFFKGTAVEKPASTILVVG